MKGKYLTTSPAQTKKLGKFLAQKILKAKIQKRAQVLGLEGELGGGKTTFLKGFARGMGVKEKILSPTFVLMKKLGIPNSTFKTLYHIDCYRIKHPRGLSILNLKEIIKISENIVVIEWAEKIKKILPRDYLRIRFNIKDKNKREIVFSKKD